MQDGHAVVWVGTGYAVVLPVCLKVAEVAFAPNWRKHVYDRVGAPPLLLRGRKEILHHILVDGFLDAGAGRIGDFAKFQRFRILEQFEIRYAFHPFQDIWGLSVPFRLQRLKRELLER